MGADATIFVVDDNMTNLLVVKNILKDHYKTFTLSSAQKMFELFSKVRPDLILLDIEMPEMNGYEAFARLKADGYGTIPVLFVSGNEQGHIDAARSAGCAGFVEKPFSADTLLKEIASRL